MTSHEEEKFFLINHSMLKPTFKLYHKDILSSTLIARHFHLPVDAAFDRTNIREQMFADIRKFLLDKFIRTVKFGRIYFR